MFYSPQLRIPDVSDVHRGCGMCGIPLQFYRGDGDEVLVLECPTCYAIYGVEEATSAVLDMRALGAN